MTTRSRHAVESCALRLGAWKPFQQAVDSPMAAYLSYPKRLCRCDRSGVPADLAVDLSRLTLEGDPMRLRKQQRDKQRVCYLERKRRRRTGSRSVSGRSSDRSATRRTKRCCSIGGGGGGGGVSGAYATCSDFPVVAGGTDSSGELFLNWDGNWGSDASEKRVRVLKKEMKDVDGGAGERDGLGLSSLQGWAGVYEFLANDSEYGSETGYKGDAEVGYEDDEEEDDGRLLFWGDRLADIHRIGNTETSGFPDLKSHSRCRRKKNL